MRITDFTELTTPTSNDLLVVVDVVNDITKKLKLSSLPVSTSVTTALATKQDTLVSGTNIKTINSTSLLGSGDIVIAANPSGVAGAIQFSNGSAFASDASNLFWDDTNNRLGVGTASPTSDLHIIGKDNTSARSVQVLNQQGAGVFSVANDRIVQIGDFTAQGYTGTLSFIRPSGGSRAATFTQGNTDLTLTNPNGGFFVNGINTTLRGSGSTSATTSLLVQNSSGATNLRVNDNGNVSMGDPTVSGGVGTFEFYQFWRFLSAGASIVGCYKSFQAFSVDGSRLCVNVASGSHSESASLQIDSTTKGFLPPRMTTTQRDAIATPATGLKIYNTTLGTTDTYDGATWQRFGQQTFIKGSGSTSATTSLLVQNSAGNTALTVRDDREVVCGAGLTVGSSIFADRAISQNGSSSLINNTSFNSQQSYPRFGLTTDASVFYYQANFNPTSGSGAFAVFNATPTINQTGGANGITRGLYINPTLTAAADFRAIEVTEGNVLIGNTASNTAKLSIKGSGSTSATISLLVQNSGGTNMLQVKDDGDITNGVTSSADLKFEISPVANKFFRLTRQGVNVDFFSGSAGNAGITVSGTANPFNVSAASANLNLSNGGVRVGSSYATTNASAQLEVVSTTKGFLPPRMTTTEKNAIATPAAGLVVYDTTTNKLCCYNGSTWNDLF